MGAQTPVRYSVNEKSTYLTHSRHRRAGRCLPFHLHRFLIVFGVLQMLPPLPYLVERRRTPRAHAEVRGHVRVARRVRVLLARRDGPERRSALIAPRRCIDWGPDGDSSGVRRD